MITNNKLFWWDYPTYFLNNFEVKDPIGFDQRLTTTKLAELLYRKDRGDSGGFNRVQLVASPISSITEGEKKLFQIKAGGLTIANEELINGYLRGEISQHFPAWLMIELLQKGVFPEPIFSTKRVIFKDNV